MKNVSNVLLGATLLTIAACGNDGGNSTPPASKSMLLTEAGKYHAKLAPLNSHLAGDVSGEAIIRVKGDDFAVEVKVNGSPAQIVHQQNIHLAESCPTLASDLNNDGIIDAVEGQKNYGQVVIPLNNQLRAKLEKEIRFPVADFTGNYYYRQNASILEMMMDLNIKSGLGLAGRQVVIYGISPDVTLPETVSPLNGQSKHASLPIACGTLLKVASDIEGSTSNGAKD